MLFKQDLSKSVHCLLREGREEKKLEIDQAMISCMLRSGKRQLLGLRHYLKYILLGRIALQRFPV